ncbi:hypothetical protein HCX50_16080 [Microbacterium oxydans]|uniref:hypothetical protein n=1 Tax=Microbacterium sp. B19(2022) TaxID=2914045 RepID=UPI0014302F64|nr:hypothetical protein [Microbacterium sp. B19(2022)]NJI60948.1 hypothetical protein [Microbacterium sp. B19(2022)]
MIGETVTVLRRIDGPDNAHGEPTQTIDETNVDDVLVAPGPRADISDTARPAGTVVAWNLHFPKTFTGSLRGALIRVRGQAPCKVIGDPQPFTADNTPTRWWMPVEVTRADG